MLTEQQIKNIHKLDAQTCMELMHECAERLGCVSVKEYEEIMQMPRRTIYSYIEQNKIKYFQIGDHKFPCINN